MLTTYKGAVKGEYFAQPTPQGIRDGMTGLEFAAGGLALLVAILLAMVARQRRELARAADVAEAVSSVALARNGELPADEAMDDTLPSRFARAARQLAARGEADSERSMLRSCPQTKNDMASGRQRRTADPG